MSRPSVKRRLIEALESERRDAARSDVRGIYLLRELRDRGSGPLPYHLRAEAKRRGIT